MRLALFQPDIPQNTGTLLRLGACLDVELDIIEPCGFIFSERTLKRSGMDYLDMVKYRRHDSWLDFLDFREKHPDMVEKFLMKVDLVLNPSFTKETAKYAVSKLKNKDGTMGEHWNYDTTEKVLYSKGYDFDDADWYYALNMIYSDYYKSGRSDDTYIDLAHDFLSDSDAPKNKAKRYFLAMCY